MQQHYLDLINYSTYSMGGGLLEIKDIIDNAKLNNRQYAALTDYNTLAGIPKFIEECEKNNLKPIVGVTLSISKNNEYLGDSVFIAKDEKGFDDLKKLVSKLGKFNVRKQSTIDIEEIKKYSKSLLMIEGGKRSITEQVQDNEKFSEVFSELSQSFGLSLIMTLQSYENESYREFISKRIAASIKKFPVEKADKSLTNHRVVITNSNRFLEKEDYLLQMNNMHENSFLTPNLRKRKESLKSGVVDKNDRFLTEEELQAGIFKLDYYENQNLILNEKNLINKIKSPKIFKEPDFPKLSKNETLQSILTEKWSEFKQDIPVEQREMYYKRLKEELKVIKDLGFEDYFVITNGISVKSKNENHSTAIRGSGAASLIVHVLGLSDIDPIKHDLMFGRFMNAGRKEYPDLDVESSHNKEMLQLLKEDYGSENMANLMAFDTYSKCTSTIEFAVQSLRRYASQDLEFQKRVNKVDNLLKKSLVFYSKSKKKVSDLVKENYYWQAYADPNKEMPKKERTNFTSQERRILAQVIKLAQKMEGKVNNKKISIGSAILSTNPINETLSVVETNTDVGADYYIEVSKEYIQKMGHLKMDILSSNILYGLNKTAKQSNVSLKNLAKDLEDPSVYQAISRNLISHVNQISSRLILNSDINEKNKQGIGSTMCQEIQPRNFNELMAIMALIRMGEEDKNNEGGKPEQYQKYIDGRNNPEQIHYKHIALKEVLEETYGAIIFEEQIMKISQKIANFNDSEADDLRSVIKKEKRDRIPEFKNKFISGALNNGISQEIAESIFSDIEEKMGQYQFNKAHAAVYATIAYQQMYLKINHPAEFFDNHYDEAKSDKIGRASCRERVCMFV